MENEAQDYKAVDASNPRCISLDSEGLMGELRMKFYVQLPSLDEVVTGADLTNLNGWYGLTGVDLSAATDPLIAGTPLATVYTVPIAQVILDWSRVLNTYDSNAGIESYDQKVKISTSESSDGLRTSITLDFPVNTSLAFQASDLENY